MGHQEPHPATLGWEAPRKGVAPAALRVDRIAGSQSSIWSWLERQDGHVNSRFRDLGKMKSRRTRFVHEAWRLIMYACGWVEALLRGAATTRKAVSSCIYSARCDAMLKPGLHPGP